MSKTDDVIKQELTNIGNYKSLKMRGFIGSSNYDQELWVDGGLTFRHMGRSYGSNDFAWYREEQWVEPGTDIVCNCKPIIVVEGTDCLNTKSYGTAQIQRFHHAFGPFMNGNIICIYYLKQGEYDVREDLISAIYYANFAERYCERNAAYLVTTDIKVIEKLVRLVGDFGEKSAETWAFIEEILAGMKKYFTKKTEKYRTLDEYLNKHYIFKQANGDWIKYIGAKKRSFTDSSIRYGHIVLGEAFVAHYLLAGNNCLSGGQKMEYFFPLLSSVDLASLKSVLIKDKEFLILSSGSHWTLKTIDDITFSDGALKCDIAYFTDPSVNLNLCRKKWNAVRKRIEKELRANTYILR